MTGKDCELLKVTGTDRNKILLTEVAADHCGSWEALIHSDL